MPPPPSVNVIEEARVAVPATAPLPPEPLRLSALDAQWVTLPLIQRQLIFVDGAGSIPPFESAVAALRASLAETVARSPPLAARIVHQPATGDAAIDCTAAGVAAAGGVRFLVAEMGADAARLAGEEEHDAAAFGRLVPVLDAGQLPAETMAAQVTRLRGGLALGVAVHHAVADGRSVWMFLEAWAAACRGDVDAAVAAPPAFDRAAVRLPGGEELARTVLRKYAPNLPLAAVAGHLIRPNLSRRTFTITAQDMRRLKQRITDDLSPAAAAVQLRRRRGALVGILRPRQAPGGQRLRRRRGLPFLLRRLPHAPRPAAGGQLLRDVHLRLPGASRRAGPPRRKRTERRRRRGGGGDPARRRGPAGRVGLDEHSGGGGPGQAGEPRRVNEVPGVRGDRLRVGPAW
ncbi:unnamed protein product [Urochloa decumbens]|uniref:Uncharacterized protein n=1 Tax=Urochloa decumbens TaxID=240449 RepID=A0ABC9BTR4_9POAL